MGEPAIQGKENVHSFEEFLTDMLRQIEFLDQVVHATRDQLQARLRVLERAQDAGFVAMVRDAEAFIRSGADLEPDSPELLEKRFHHLPT